MIGRWARNGSMWAKHLDTWLCESAFCGGIDAFGYECGRKRGFYYSGLRIWEGCSVR